MVLHLCREGRAIHMTNEDDYQATFLASLRAASIRAGDISGAGARLAISGGVPCRAQGARPKCLNAKREGETADAVIEGLLTTGPSCAMNPSLRELTPVPPEEVQRLPAKYAYPIVLCYLQGLITEECGRKVDGSEGASPDDWPSPRLLRKRLSLRG